MNNYYFFIKQILAKWKTEAGIFEPIGFKLRHNMDEETCEIKAYIIEIYTDKPGIMIGYHGALVDKYKKIFEEYYHGTKTEIDFVELNGCF